MVRFVNSLCVFIFFAVARASESLLYGRKRRRGVFGRIADVDRLARVCCADEIAGKPFQRGLIDLLLCGAACGTRRDDLDCSIGQLKSLVSYSSASSA